MVQRRRAQSELLQLLQRESRKKLVRRPSQSREQGQEISTHLLQASHSVLQFLVAFFKRESVFEDRLARVHGAVKLVVHVSPKPEA